MRRFVDLALVLALLSVRAANRTKSPQPIGSPRPQAPDKRQQPHPIHATGARGSVTATSRSQAVIRSGLELTRDA